MNELVSPRIRSCAVCRDFFNVRCVSMIAVGRIAEAYHNGGESLHSAEKRPIRHLFGIRIFFIDQSEGTVHIRADIFRKLNIQFTGNT